MASSLKQIATSYDATFKIFHDLMKNRIREILLVCSPYDAFIMEEDGSLASKIINEYRGLNLSRPPRMTRVSTGLQTLAILKKKKFDLVITRLNIRDIDAFSLGKSIKKIDPHLPVILLIQEGKESYIAKKRTNIQAIDNYYVWSSNPDLMLAVVKNIEDHLNAEHDTALAMVRILILVEDSPYYRSFLLPYLYKELVLQTQSVLHESLNEEHRFLKIRARPKILVAGTFEEALLLYRKFKPYVFGIISDTRFPRNEEDDFCAGIHLLQLIRDEVPDLPLLLLSSDEFVQSRAEQIPSVFSTKNSKTIRQEIHNFFLTYLGFGDFIFRTPAGHEIGRASNINAFEKIVKTIPDESLRYHAHGNHFSNWIMARSEVALAGVLQKKNLIKIKDLKKLRAHIINEVHFLRKKRQEGVVARFTTNDLDADIMDFSLIGEGSMGGKALGLAFMARQFLSFGNNSSLFSGVKIKIPKTLSIATEAFESFIDENNLSELSLKKDDDSIAQLFLGATLPQWVKKKLYTYLSQVTVPLCVRSSSLLEDVQYLPYAGMYETYMIPNNHPDVAARLNQLVTAIKLVYASTYFSGPKSVSNTRNREDSMGVIIQELAGQEYGEYFYPAISGVARSHNFYPIPPMKPEDGIAHIAVGFGKVVVEGEKSIFFSPKYPNHLPQFSTVDDILSNSQRSFYSLRMKGYSDTISNFKNSNLEKRDISDIETEFPLHLISSTYKPTEQKIIDSLKKGPKIITFAPILKYNIFPLPLILERLLTFGCKWLGTPVELEFAINFNSEKNEGEFFCLQLRPMTKGGEQFDVKIDKKTIDRSFCFSNHALGHGKVEGLTDIVYVKKDSFQSSLTGEIAREVGRLNATLLKEERPYILIGPGRWGSADRWLGIPVRWHDISGVRVIVELQNENLKADPSQGTHFFQNITSSDVHYLAIAEQADRIVPREISKDFIDWEWLNNQPVLYETTYLTHVRLDNRLILKSNGQKLQSVLYVE